MVKLPSNINILPSKNSEATRWRQRCCGSRHNARNWWEKTWKHWIGRRQNGLRWSHGAEDVGDGRQNQREFYWMSKSGVHQRGTLHVVNKRKWRYKQQGPVQKLPCWGCRINSGNRIINMDSRIVTITAVDLCDGD